MAEPIQNKNGKLERHCQHSHTHIISRADTFKQNKKIEDGKKSVKNTKLNLRQRLCQEIQILCSSVIR